MLSIIKNRIMDSKKKKESEFIIELIQNYPDFFPDELNMKDFSDIGKKRKKIKKTKRRSKKKSKKKKRSKKS